MARRKVKLKPSFLVQPDTLIDRKFANWDQARIDAEIAKCKNGIEGLKYFINEYIYVPNKIKPEILKEKPTWFQHLLFEKEKINLKLYPKQIEYLETLQGNRLVASYKSRQCLPKGSIVFTPQGPVEIQNLRPNDVVYSFNEETGLIEADIVVDAWKSGVRDCNRIRTLDGNVTIQGRNHPFLLMNGEQARSNELNKGDILINNQGIFGDIDVPDYECSCLSKSDLLPESVFQQNKKSVALILNRIFTNRGNANDGTITLESQYSIFIYQIKQLLWNFGIGCEIKKSLEVDTNGRYIYQLVIDNAVCINVFLDEIGLIDERFKYTDATDTYLNRIISIDENQEIECQDIETLKNKNFIFEGRVVHNTGITTITEAFVLQYATFNDNKEIVVISKAEQEAVKFLDAVYYMYNHLPFFLRRQYSKAVKKSLHLGPLNKATKINVLTSTSKSGRSFSATILILDEAEFIEHADDLWAAAQPTLSATGGQAIVISTPWQYKSWFWKVCHGEEEDAFKIFKINWSDIPGRDDAWYQAQCAELHHDRLKIQTELDMQWIIPFQKYYSEEFLDRHYVIKPSEFYQYEKEYGLGIILPPKDGMEYYFGIDTYEGGLDNNAGVIIGSDMRIYSYFKTQRIDVFELIKALCDLYHTKVCVERNRGFWLIKDFMDRELHKKYILYRAVKRKNIYEEQWGFLINGENRKKLIASTSDYLKYVHNWNKSTETDMIKLAESIYDEMNYFVIKKSRVEGLEHDDLIFALIAALYVRDNKNTFTNQKTDQARSNVSGLVNTFYGTVNGASANSLLANGKINTIIARNFLSGIGKGNKMTPDQLDMLDQVLNFGKNLIDKVDDNKQKDNANEC